METECNRLQRDHNARRRIALRKLQFADWDRLPLAVLEEVAEKLSAARAATETGG
jgi:hypothetical protein